jgi:hypothetical protein
MSLTLVAGILGFSASASAGWQGAEWGMSQQEVDKSFRIPHTPGAPLFDYTTGNISFHGGFLDFDSDGGLNRIGLILDNKMLPGCEDLFGIYRNIYGNPVSDEKRPDEHEAIWHDPSHNNKITVRAERHGNDNSISFCGVYYEPLAPLAKPKLTPAPGGL